MIRSKLDPSVRLLALTIALALPSPAAAAAKQSKSGYHLLSPTPRSQMRELEGDRPDGTESPRTVDAGHVQAELSVVDFTHDSESGFEVDRWTILETNLRVGLMNNVGLQLIFSAYAIEEVSLAGEGSETTRGFGDIALRAKVNLWGNDGGTTAFGVMPYIKIPTHTALSNGQTEGGVLLMLGWDAGETWGLGGQIEVNAVYDEGDENHDVELVHTTAASTDIVGPLGCFIEFIGALNTEAPADYRAIFSGGLTLGLGANIALDVATQVGLSDAADDIKVFGGMVLRI